MNHEIRSLQLADEPVPVLLVECAAGRSARTKFADDFLTWIWEVLPASEFAMARGVDFDRLASIASNGCDVMPTDSPFYATPYLSKAVEYGLDGDQVIQFFSPMRLDLTYREVDANLPVEELRALSKSFPTRLSSKDGKKLWLSRLAENDRGIATEYEWEYARWIAGNAFDALVALLVLGADFRAVQSRTIKTLSAAANGRWKLLAQSF